MSARPPTANTKPRHLEIAVDASTRVSALLVAPPSSKACLVLAHGAGAGMEHPFMESVSAGLAARAIATLRYQFPYMERRGRRPDTPLTCQAAVRAATATAAALLPALPLLAGGKSFGGRMTSQAQAAAPLPGVRGLVFLGFPLHSPKQPSESRGEHLSKVHIPMLFLQGERDAYAEPALLQALIERLGRLATVCRLPDADHSFRVPVRSLTAPGEIGAKIMAALASWVDAIIA